MSHKLSAELTWLRLIIMALIRLSVMIFCYCDNTGAHTCMIKGKLIRPPALFSI